MAARPAFKNTNVTIRAEKLAKSVRRYGTVSKKELRSALGRVVNLEGVDDTKVDKAVDDAMERIPKVDKTITKIRRYVLKHTPRPRGRPRKEVAV